MVEEKLPKQLNNLESRSEDTGSISINDSDCQIAVCEDNVEVDECGASYGNILVKNSTGVQFGNKTHIQYEGPVTIKQFIEGDDEIGEKDDRCKKKDENNDVKNVVKEEDTNRKQCTQGTKCLNYIHKKRKIFICSSIILTIFLILLIVLLVITPTTEEPSWREETNLSGKLKIIQRHEWLAELPKEKLDSLSLPVPYVLIAHTAAQSCTNRGECTDLVRFTQHYHMNNRGWSDIGYNFLIGGDGFVYEGRGWEKVGAHTKSWNSKSIGIAFIGTFEDLLPPKRQIEAGKMLIAFGEKLKYLAEDYKVYAHLQVSDKLSRSPGEVFYEDIKTWPHWANRSNTNR